MRARAALLEEAGGPVRVVDDLEVAAPRAGEVLVEVASAGICGSDLAVLSNRFPFPLPLVLGHEAAGTVVVAGPDTVAPPPGSVVALWMRPPCRACRACIRGDAGLCETTGAMSARGTLPDGSTQVSRAGQVVHRAFGVGAFASHVVMPTSGVIPLPPGTGPDVAALISCGVATGAGAILNVAGVSVGETVVVFGGGGVGLSAALASLAVGARHAIVVDPSPDRRQQAVELGATGAVPPAPDVKELRGEIRAITGSPQVDVAVDAVGAPGIIESGFRLVRQGGRVVCVGLSPVDAHVSLPATLLATSHKQVLGCYMGGIDPHRDLPRIVALQQRGVLPIERMVTRRCALDEIEGAVADMEAGRGLRTIVHLGAGGATVGA